MATELMDFGLSFNNVELMRLSRKVPEVLKNLVSANTYKSYTLGFKKWLKWVQKFKFQPFPVNKKHLMLFIAELTEESVSVAVLNNILYSISWVHNKADLEDPCKSNLISKMRLGAKKMLSKPISKKDPISPDMLKTTVSYFGQEKKNLMNWRFICMCLLGYYGFFRFSEISNIKRSDIKIFDNRLEIYVAQSKTDKFKEGAWTVIAATEDSVCPKDTLRHYLTLAKFSDTSDEFIFRNIIKYGTSYKLHKNKKLSYSRAREILLQNLEKNGFSKSCFGLHSMRSGGATASSNAGVAERLIQNHGRWKSDKSMKGYIHDSLESKMSVTQSLFN